MAQNNLPYYLGFSHFLGIGPVRFGTLMSHFGDVEKAYGVTKQELSKLIGPNMAEKFVVFRSRFDPSKKLAELKQKSITVLTQEDELYPSILKNISDPPICLYVKGDLKGFNFSEDYFFAVVGTRKPTAYGEQIAEKFASELAQAGFVIVSGMAYGIDAKAHWAAIKASGRTVAFLGCGVDIVYPGVNKGLYEQIIKTGGLVISEFPPGQTVLKGLFVARNRLISGLSSGVLVVEGAKDSGSLITARYAANQGKEVFAPPAPLTSEMSQAPNLLLKQGAKLVTSIEDILDEFQLTVSPKKKEEIVLNLNKEEKMIFDVLTKEPKMTDEIIMDTNFEIGQMLNLLSILEIKGVIEKNSAGKYQIKIG